ncbi:hypothetical protein WJ968_26940 [Achromobacter xylosoxidans]
MPLDRARGAGARAPGRAPHPPRAGRAHLPPRRQHLDSDHELPSQIETDSERQAQLALLYFEVLIVDEMSASEEDALRRRVQRKRSADDDFIFDVVVVPTFEDALIATLVNFNLQAVVIRHGPVSLGQPQPHAAPLPGRHGRQGRGHARVRARPAAGPPDRADPA